MEKHLEVPEELWKEFIDASAANMKQQVAIRDQWHKIADSLGLVRPTMQIVDEDKRLVSGEPVPTPELIRFKQLLLVVDAIRSLSAEDQAKALELAQKEPVRLLGQQVGKLYDGWDVDSAYLLSDDAEAEGTVLGKVLALTEGESNE